MKRYGSDGDPNPNGEFYLARDVSKLEDQLEDALKQVAKLKQEVAVGDERHRVMVLRLPTQFGYVDPLEASGYLGGRSMEIVVSRARTDSKFMPVCVKRGPRYFRRPCGSLPQLTKRVYVEGEKGRVIGYSKKVDKALIIKMDGGQKVETINWSLVDDAQRHAERGTGVDGQGSGYSGRGIGEGATGCESVESSAGG